MTGLDDARSGAAPVNYPPQAAALERLLAELTALPSPHLHLRQHAAADNYFQIESSLRQAIERDEFEVHYQPIIDLQTTSPAAFEALVRWRHPAKGLLAPGYFISVAEESGLIGRIGTLVLRTVCRQLRDWIDIGYQPPRIAINLSPIQFRDPDLISGIMRTIDEFSLTPALIELERGRLVVRSCGASLGLGCLNWFGCCLHSVVNR